MSESNAVPHVFKAIHAVLSELSIDGISKDNKNAQQGYKFRGIDDVLNALSGSLARNNLIILPQVKKREVSERESKGGGALFSVVVETDYIFTSAVDGSQALATVIGEAMDSADKATNKAMSAAYKYMALQTFCIPTEGDNDADGTTHEPRARTQDERPARQVDPQQQRAAEKPEAQQQQKTEHPLLMNLRTLLAKYGPEKAPLFATKTAESMGVKRIEDIPVAQLPQALQKVMDHQKAAKAAKAAAANPAEGTKPAAAKKPAGKKAPLPEPDNTPAPDLQEPDADDGDGIPV